MCIRHASISTKFPCVSTKAFALSMLYLQADGLNVLCLYLCAGPATCVTVRFALTDHKVYSGKPEQKAFIRGRSVIERLGGQLAR